MPIIHIRFIKDVVATPAQKKELIEKMTDTFVSVLGDVVRPFVYCIVEETPQMDWGIGGQPMPDLPFLTGPVYHGYIDKSNEIMSSVVKQFADQAEKQREENKAVFDQWFAEAWNKGNFDIADKIIDPDFQVHGAGGQKIGFGIPGLKGLINEWRTAFPDGHMDVYNVIGEGDIIAAYTIWRGTHLGTFYGNAPSGKKVEVTSIGIDRVANGKIAEGWGELDMIGMMQQMGVMPGWQPKPAAPVPPNHVNDGPRTTPEQNKATVRRFIDEVFNKGNYAVGDEVFWPDATSPSAPQLPTGGAGVRFIAEMFRGAFPDFHMDIDILIAEGDQVVAHFIETGTHKGELMGMAPTGKPVKFTESGILRFEGGKIVESWYEVDMMTLIQTISPASGS